MKFIISGDFNQLKPVKTKYHKSYQNTPALFILCDGNRLILTKCRRADEEYFNICKNVITEPKSVSPAKFPCLEMTYKNLAFTHTTRINVNNLCMIDYLLKTKKQFIEIKALDINPKTQNIKLAVGMPVIAHKNRKQMKFVNSENFVVKKISKTEIILSGQDFDGKQKEIKITPDQFHQMFYLAFCITIHSSQGISITEKYTIHDWKMIGHLEDESNIKYVALSRGTTKSQLQIVE